MQFEKQMAWQRFSRRLPLNHESQNGKALFEPSYVHTQEQWRHCIADRDYECSLRDKDKAHLAVRMENSNRKA